MLNTVVRTRDFTCNIQCYLLKNGFFDRRNGENRMNGGGRLNGSKGLALKKQSVNTVIDTLLWLYLLIIASHEACIGAMYKYLWL